MAFSTRWVEPGSLCREMGWDGSHAHQELLRRCLSRRLGRGRNRAKRTIDTALRVCDVSIPSNEQLADLADAVDAFAARQFAVAVDLAEAAMRRGRSRLKGAERPAAMARSLAELRAAFGEMRR